MSFTTLFGEFLKSCVILDIMGLSLRGLGTGDLSGRRMRRIGGAGVEVPVRNV